MGDGIETIFPAMLEALTFLLDNGYLRAADLVSLEASSRLFREPSQVEPYKSLSITASAACQSCENHPLFADLPQVQYSALVARCKGNWKLVLHYLKASDRLSGRSTNGKTRNWVLAEAGASSSLIVNKKEELYACGKSNYCVLGQEPATCELEITLKLISLPSTSKRIVQISSSFEHAAFVTGNEQGIPCQQVAAGNGFTLAVTQAGEVYSWGEGGSGQLGHGDTQDEFRPRKVEQLDVSDPVVQVTAGFRHSLAVTKFGQLFTWGHNFGCEMGPNRVEDGGFDMLFIDSAAAGNGHCAAIDSFGRVYTWGTGILSALGREDVVGYQHSPLLVDSLKGSRAVQVVARTTTCVLLDSGTIHCFGHLAPRNWARQWQPSHGRTYMKSLCDRWSQCLLDRLRTAPCPCSTEKGSIFGFGSNCLSQLGMIIPRFNGSDSIYSETSPFDGYEFVGYCSSNDLPVNPPCSSCEEAPQCTVHIALLLQLSPVKLMVLGALMLNEPNHNLGLLYIKYQ